MSADAPQRTPRVGVRVAELPIVDGLLVGHDGLLRPNAAAAARTRCVLHPGGSTVVVAAGDDAGSPPPTAASGVGGSVSGSGVDAGGGDASLCAKEEALAARERALEVELRALAAQRADVEAREVAVARRILWLDERDAAALVCAMAACAVLQHVERAHRRLATARCTGEELAAHGTCVYDAHAAKLVELRLEAEARRRARASRVDGTLKGLRGAYAWRDDGRSGGRVG